MTTIGRPGNRSLSRYVLGVAVAGTCGVAAAAFLLPAGPVDALSAAALAGVAALSSWVPLRFQHRGGIQGFTLEEGVFVAMLFALPPGTVPVLLAAAALVAHAIKLRDVRKIAFNVGQVAAWSAVGVGVFHAIGPGPEVLAPRSVLAVVAATLALNGVSHLLMAELFRRLDGRSYRQSAATITRLHLVTWLGNTSFGLILAFVVLEDPLAAVLASTLMLGLYLGYRGYAGVLEERRRNERLHEVTRMLVEAPDTPDAFERFLRGLARLLGGDSAELVLTGDASHCVYTAGPETFTVTALTQAPPGAGSDAIRHRVARFVTRHDDPTGLLEHGDHQDALAAPLLCEGGVLGALVVYDRHGLEPWEHTDTQLLGSVAHEAAVALKNVELFATVDRERARLEAQSRRLGDIVDAASDGIAVIDADGTVAAWNPAMSGITGLTASEAVGQHWFVALRLREADGSELPVQGDSPLHRALRGVRHDEPVDVQVLRRDGRWRWLRCTLAPIRPHDDGAGTVIVARDTTREREVDQLKADFISTVSHELRTPLTPLKGFVETLRDSGDLLSDGQLATVYDSMSRQVERLDTLVADLLAVAGIERGGLGLRTEAFDLQALARDVVSRAGGSDRVTLGERGPVAAIGDPGAVIRILRALLSNALKHTAGAVSVTTAWEAHRAFVHVADEGPGLHPWELDRIFERFARLGDYLRRTQGPGLGLSLARALARELGGDVTVTSEIGFGSVFTLELPAAESSAGRSGDADPPSTRRAAHPDDAAGGGGPGLV